MGKLEIVILLNDRRKYADIFWFSFFHEIGHVLQKRIKMLMISDKNRDWIEEDELTKRLEEGADSFAQNILIPKDEYSIFISKQLFNQESILAFADKIKIHAGIVLGRLQKEQYIPYQSNMNTLKQKYCVVTDKR